MEYGYTIDENTGKGAGLYLTEFTHFPRVGEQGWVGGKSMGLEMGKKIKGGKKTKKENLGKI